MSDPLDPLSSRRDYSKRRLEEVRSRVEEIVKGDVFPDLCIYVTGSFGRLEASKYSDLDLFFVHRGSSRSNSIPRIRKTLLDADLIRAVQDLRFPEFSNDGEYLAIHYLDDIRGAMGGPDDDFRNFFTARLLLLLESQPLFNEALYEGILKEIIDSYWSDYSNHEASFRPLFLNERHHAVLAHAVPELRVPTESRRGRSWRPPQKGSQESEATVQSPAHLPFRGRPALGQSRFREPRSVVGNRQAHAARSSRPGLPRRYRERENR